MKKSDVRRVLMGLAVLGGLLFALTVTRGWFGPSVPSEETLAKALKGVDRVRVRSGGTCHRDATLEQTLCEETDPERIRQLLASVRIDTEKSVIDCACCGGPSIEFYRGGELVVTLGCHHGHSLRWAEGWRADGVLTADGAAALEAWLKAHRVDLPGG